jgi:hypothetical protein
MKALLLLACVFSSFAFAKVSTVRSSTPAASEAAGDKAVYLNLVPYGGGIGFGGKFEMASTSNFGFGGGVLILPEKKSGTDLRPSLIALGGNVVLHFPVDMFDLYASPGLNLMMMEFGTEDKTTIGASMALGTLAQITPQFAAGVEFAAYHPWFNKEFYGAGRTYFTNSSITGRISF